MRDQARAFLLQERPRVTLLVEGSTDEELLNGILNENQFSVISVSKYSPTAYNRKGGAKKRVIEEVSNVYCNAGNISSPVLGFVDMDADHSQEFLQAIVTKFLQRNHKDSKIRDSILQKINDTRLETCTFGYVNQYANNGRWDWIKQVSCLKRRKIDDKQLAQLISTAKLRSYIHSLKQDNQQRTNFPKFDSFWDYTNPSQEKMEREGYLEKFPKYEDWKSASKKYDFPDQCLNDHCLEWTIFDFVYQNLSLSISKMLSRKDIIVNQLQNKMKHSLSLQKVSEEVNISFREMYNLD